MPERTRTWTEDQSQRWLAWLARSLQRQERTILMLEEMQPTWLARPGVLYLVSDALLGAAIGALVAPLAIVIPSYFGPGQAQAIVSTSLVAIVTGALLGAGFARSSAKHVARYSAEARGPAEDGGGPTAADGDLQRAPVPDSPAHLDPTVSGTERTRGTQPPGPTKKGGGWGSWLGCLGLGPYVGLVAGAGLLALNWLMSQSFADTVGLRNALAVLLVLVASGLFRSIENHRLRSTGRFIRPAEALGWSTRPALGVCTRALVYGLPVAFVATRLLDGWLGNRPEAAVRLQGRGFAFEGPYGIGSHLFGLSDQGVALLLFLWGTIASAGFVLGGLRSRVVELKTKPNQGMRLSLRNAILCQFAVGVPVGVVLALGLLYIRPAAARLTFLQLPDVVPVEVLAARLLPSVARSAREVVAGVDLLGRLDSTARLDTLRAWADAGRHQADFAVASQGPAQRAVLLDTVGLSRELAVRLQRDRDAFAVGRQRRITGPRGIAIYMVTQDPRIAGTPEAWAPLFAPVPVDSLPPSIRAARDLRADRTLALWLGLALGITIGGLAALLNGGMAVVRHYLLRWRLKREGVAPLDYTGFLDYACDQLGFLERVGGGYMFIHRMLLEHFAEERAA